MRTVAISATLAALLVLGAGCAHGEAAERDDLVVAGYVETVDSEEMDEWGLNVRFTGRLRDIRVLRGRPPPSPPTIRYIAHTNRDPGREMTFRLRASDDGIWLVCREGGGRGYACN